VAGLPHPARRARGVAPWVSADRASGLPDRSSGGIALLTRIRIVEQTGSTNADLLAHPAALEGDWLVALNQFAGRGRQGRTWLSFPGNFYGSTLVELRSVHPAPQTLSLAACPALVEAIDVAVPGRGLWLKWPNDELLLGQNL